MIYDVFVDNELQFEVEDADVIPAVEDFITHIKTKETYLVEYRKFVVQGDNCKFKIGEEEFNRPRVLQCFCGLHCKRIC